MEDTEKRQKYETIPEYEIVKREILASYYMVIHYHTKIKKFQFYGNENQNAIRDFFLNLLNLHMKIRMKREYRDSDTCKELDGLIKEKIPQIDIDKCLAWFFDMQSYIEKLGLTMIERRVTDPEDSWREGMYE
jgi:hypothetical protein